MNPLKHVVRYVLLAALLIPGLAGATTFVRLSDADLADQAAVIAEVTIAGLDYSQSAAMPVTDYRVEATRVLRGDLPGSSVVVRMHGGKDRNGMELMIYGVPSFKAGERALLFLQPATDGTYRVLHVMQGAFRILESGGQSYAMRDFGEADELQIAGRSIEAERPRDLDRFASWIADRASGAGRPADYFVDDAPVLDSITQKYTLLTRNGYSMRWPEFDANQNITFRAHSAGQPGRTGGGFDDLQAAMAAWNDEAVTNIRYRYGGTTTLTAGFTEYDGVNAVVWDNLDNAGEFENPFTCGTGGTLAIGGPWFSSTTRHTHQGQQFITIQGADIVTNDGLECWININRRLEEVLAHELGHTLGLAHSCGDDEAGACNSSVKNDALMRAQAHGDSRGASLRSDDLAAINLLYGTGVNATPPAAPSNLRATAQGGSVLVQWTDNSGDEDNFLLERRSTGSFQQIYSGGANSNSFLDNGGTSGTTYTYRVRAVNEAGASGYSNEASATPQSGELAPTNLAAVATGPTTVSLTWNDNAATETGYQVEAKLEGGVYEVISSIPADAESLQVTGLFPESNYRFRVRATGGLGTSAYSNEAEATTAPAPVETCVPNATRLCLTGGRFQVEVRWKDFGGVQGSGQAVPVVSTDSGLFYFFSENNWEMLVKVLDGCSINQRFWVYAAATTNVEYTLFVTDTATGATKNYFNALGRNAPAITDGAAFNTCGLGLEGGEAAMSSLPEIWSPDAPSVLTAAIAGASAPLPAVEAEEGDLTPRATCADTGTALCLQGERFKVEVTWTDFGGASGPGRVVPVGNADSGLFYFFSPNNWEMLVKVLNGCSINNRIWVLAAATTDVAYSLKVTDMNNPGSPKTYTNPLGVASPAVIDIEAFASCN